MALGSNICIDWGNTRVKVGIFNDNKLLKSFNFSHEEGLDQIMSINNDYRPEHGIFCAVAQYPEELPHFLNQDLDLLILNDQTNLPFMNAYQNKETLGADRLALVAAAQNLFPGESSLTISIGTAITYNFLQNGKTFRGGNITPGVAIRLQSLNDYTDALPLVKPQGAAPLLGFDTETGIRSGVLWGIAAEIEGLIEFYKTQYSCNHHVISGGDLPYFEKMFKNKTFAAPNLLLKGLNLILQTNVH